MDQNHHMLHNSVEEINLETLKKNVISVELSLKSTVRSCQDLKFKCSKTSSHAAISEK